MIRGQVSPEKAISASITAHLVFVVLAALLTGHTPSKEVVYTIDIISPPPPKTKTITSKANKRRLPPPKKAAPKDSPWLDETPPTPKSSVQDETAKQALALKRAKEEKARMLKETLALKQARKEEARQIEEARMLEEARLEEARQLEEARLEEIKLAEEARQLKENRLEEIKRAKEARAHKEDRLEQLREQDRFDAIRQKAATTVSKEPQKEMSESERNQIMLKYGQLIEARIKANWVYALTGEDNELSTKISITVKKNGAVELGKVEESSGDRAFDRTAVKAILKTKKVDPPPFGRDEDIILNFYPE